MVVVQGPSIQNWRSYGLPTGDFSDTTGTTESEKCIVVLENKVAIDGGRLGTACAERDPGLHLFGNDRTFAACGEISGVNTTTFFGANPVPGVVLMDRRRQVPCQLGCTLTQGYWKTHSERGPAASDHMGGSRNNRSPSSSVG